MMPINEAITILKKIRDCETAFCYGKVCCSECPYWVGQIRKISALETAVKYIEEKNGEKHEQNI